MSAWSMRALGRDLARMAAAAGRRLLRARRAPARYAPGQTQEGAPRRPAARARRLWKRRFPGLKATVTSGSHRRPAGRCRPSRSPRDARIVKTLNAAYQAVRGEPQPTGAISAALASTAPMPAISIAEARHGRRRLRAWRALQHHARRARRHRATILDMIRIYMLTILDICEVA